MKKDKVKIEVFVPLGSCVCNFAPFMEKIGRAMSGFKDVTEVQTKSNKSSEASKYGVQEMGIVINGKIKLSASFEEKDLQDAISQESKVDSRGRPGRSVIVETGYEKKQRKVS